MHFISDLFFVFMLYAYHWCPIHWRKKCLTSGTISRTIGNNVAEEIIFSFSSCKIFVRTQLVSVGLIPKPCNPAPNPFLSYLVFHPVYYLVNWLPIRLQTILLSKSRDLQQRRKMLLDKKFFRWSLWNKSNRGTVACPVYSPISSLDC